jgi:hypothetical protein
MSLKVCLLKDCQRFNWPNLEKKKTSLEGKFLLAAKEVMKRKSKCRDAFLIFCFWVSSGTGWITYGNIWQGLQNRVMGVKMD